jgi:hypothetical protein
MRATGPDDFSLRQTQRLVIGMLTEYAKGDADPRAAPRRGAAQCTARYGLANFAHSVLLRAQEPLPSSAAMSNRCSEDLAPLQDCGGERGAARARREHIREHD